MPEYTNVQTPLITTPPKKPLGKELFKFRWAYLFIAPFFLLFAIFGFFPTLQSLYLSLADWKGLGPITFVGLKNYILLFHDHVFWQSILNGLIIFILYVPFMTFLSLVIAVLLNSKRVRGFRFFRTLIFTPYIMNIVAAGFTFQLLLNQKYGLVNSILGVFSIPPVPWLESIWGARFSLCLLILWAWLGYNMVIMLAGLQTIPQDLTEAARIDGASQAQAFLYVTIPCMRPVLIFSFVLSTMGSFNLFNEVYNLTGGGPMNATITPIIYIFNQAFGNFRLGYASAAAYIYFAIVFALTLVQVRYSSQGAD